MTDVNKRAVPEEADDNGSSATKSKRAKVDDLDKDDRSLLSVACRVATLLVPFAHDAATIATATAAIKEHLVALSVPEAAMPGEKILFDVYLRYRTQVVGTVKKGMDAHASLIKSSIQEEARIAAIKDVPAQIKAAVAADKKGKDPPMAKLEPHATGVYSLLLKNGKNHARVSLRFWLTGQVPGTRQAIVGMHKFVQSVARHLVWGAALKVSERRTLLLVSVVTSWNWCRLMFLIIFVR